MDDRAKAKLDAIDDARLQMSAARGAGELSLVRHLEPATWDDVELHMLGKPHQAASIRARVEENCGKWLQGVLERNEATAEELEREWEEHASSSEHREWLASGGPERLWNALNERKLNAERAAEIVRAAKGDASASEAMAAHYAWQQSEMVRLFLNQAAE